MSQSANDAGRKAAIVSAQAGAPLKTASESGYSRSSAQYNKGVSQGKSDVSKRKG